MTNSGCCLMELVAVHSNVESKMKCMASSTTPSAINESVGCHVIDANAVPNGDSPCSNHAAYEHFSRCNVSGSLGSLSDPAQRIPHLSSHLTFKAL
ncbi:hypothetical protein HaLaN_20362, partial [Haematococcus lacustris]